MMYLASLVEEMKDKLDGWKFIHTKTELDIIVADNTHSNRVMIRQDFAHEYFTPTGLMNYIMNAKQVNYNIIIELDVTDEVLTKDIMISKMRGCRNIEELVELAITHDTEFIDTLKRLTDRHVSDYKEMLSYSNQIARLQAVIDEMREEINNRDYTIAQEAANKLSYQSRLHALISRINYQYGKDIDNSKLFTIDKNSYDKVLYIKEITSCL